MKIKWNYTNQIVNNLLKISRAKALFIEEKIKKDSHERNVLLDKKNG